MSFYSTRSHEKSVGSARFVPAAAIAKSRECKSLELRGHQAAALCRFYELVPNRIFDFARFGRSLRFDVSMQRYERRAKCTVVRLQRCNVEVVVRGLCELKYPAPQSRV